MQLEFQKNFLLSPLRGSDREEVASLVQKHQSSEAALSVESNFAKIIANPEYFSG
ncbi:MAG: hypothetical protein H7333_05550 [Bdellovibrionales bacterium]|nr:hypothetical protein [Oligoflexia bacterium]